MNFLCIFLGEGRGCTNACICMGTHSQPTDRPKSVRNCCLMEFFVALFVLSLCPFDISVGVVAFVIGLGQISSFLSLLQNRFMDVYKTW